MFCLCEGTSLEHSAVSRGTEVTWSRDLILVASAVTYFVATFTLKVHWTGCYVTSGHVTAAGAMSHHAGGKFRLTRSFTFTFATVHYCLYFLLSVADPGRDDSVIFVSSICSCRVGHVLSIFLSPLFHSAELRISIVQLLWARNFMS